MFEKSAVDSRIGTEQLAEVGPVRSMRLSRDLGISTAEGVLAVGVEELTQVWSIGMWTARSIFGSAQGHVRQRKARQAERRSRINVVVISCNRQFSNHSGDDGEFPLNEQRDMVKGAFEESPIDLQNDRVTARWCNDSMGCVAAESWFDGRQESKVDVTRGPRFQVDWDGHERAIDAVKERNASLVKWADQVVVPMSGEYTEFILRLADENDTSWSVFCAESSGMPTEWDDGITQKEYDHVHSEEQVANPRGDYVPEDERDSSHLQPSKFENEWKYTGAKPRDGTPDDLDMLPVDAVIGITEYERSNPISEFPSPAGGGEGRRPIRNAGTHDDE